MINTPSLGEEECGDGSLKAHLTGGKEIIEEQAPDACKVKGDDIEYQVTADWQQHDN